MAKLNPIQGNVMSVGIHMTVQTITQENGSVSTTEEDFYPNTDYPVLVVLKKGGTKYPYTASTDGYMVYFEDEGSLPVGKYQLEVLCRNDQGQPMRFMERDVIEVHDATADAGVEAGVEFDVQTYSLNGVVFIGCGGSCTETDPVFSASPAATITEAMIALWNQGGGGSGYSVTFDDGDVIFSGSTQPTFNDGNVIF